MNKIRVCFDNGMKVVGMQSTFMFQLLLYYFNIFILKIKCVLGACQVTFAISYT